MTQAPFATQAPFTTPVPTNSDLGQLVVAAFLSVGWRPGLTLQAADIADFFEAADLTRHHARIGLDYAVTIGWIGHESADHYTLVALPPA
ncbi:hypothetical protein [Methylobacterium sp. 77]|uniref:hypothetical protein n=1 Tax=Methylobacterium sp. 77 TaxID=1101192 RepID=UPI000375ADAB|nr:hypothetical protein [Methylobacterium sp. 77]